MGIDNKTLAVTKSYVKKSLEGVGALKGQKGDPGKDGKDAPTISSISIDETNVLSTTLSDGTTLSGGTIKTIVGKDGINGQDGITPHIDPTTKHWFVGDTDTGIVAKGKDGTDGIQGIRGEKGETGLQGIQGIQGVKGDKGDKGDDGYPFLIYKEYTDISKFSVDDFPKIGLMFMIKTEDATSLPVYRYTGETENPYSFVTNLSGSEGIKGDKGDKGEQGIQGEQGIAGQDGKDGTTYTPTIGIVTSLASNQNATTSVTIDEDTKTAKFNFGIPKGNNGDTPAITENVDNTSDSYRLDVKIGDKIFTTPNLMGIIGVEYKNKAVGTPVGEIISYMGTIAPDNYLICNGDIYNIADYPILAQHFVDNFGSVNYFGGDGTTTFAVPDLRGEFLRGSGTATRNTGSGNNVGGHQDGTQHLGWGLNPTESTIWIDSSILPLSGSRYTINPDKQIKVNSTTGKYASLKNWYNASGYGTYTSRPTNTSVLYCIKYQSTYWITPTNEILKEE